MKFKGSDLSQREAYAASLWAANFTFEQIQHIMNYKGRASANNIVDRARFKMNQAHMRNDQFKDYLKAHGWPKCWYCFKPCTVEDNGLTPIHEDGSFICHYEPSELPPGQPYCDCWREPCMSASEAWRSQHATP